MSLLTITKTAMSFRVPVNGRGEIKNSPFSVSDFVQKLQQWKKDPVTGSWKLQAEFFYFDEKQELLYLPYFALEEFKFLLKKYDIRYEIVDLPGEPGRPVEFYMLPHITYKNDKQKNAVEYLTNPESGRLRGLALQTGSGKGLVLDALLKTPSSWVKMGDVVLGEELVAPDGSHTKVIGVYPQGPKTVFRVEFEDGRSVECDTSHLWKIHDGESWKVLSLEELITNFDKKEFYIPLIGDMTGFGREPENQIVFSIKLEDAQKRQEYIWSRGGICTIEKVDKGYICHIQVRNLLRELATRASGNPDYRGLALKITNIKYVGIKNTQCITVDHPDQLYITDNHIVTHNTVSYIWSLQKLGVRSLITMTSRLEQWVSEFSKYTTLDPEDIYVVQGVGSLTKLFSLIDTEIKPKVILMSTRTMQIYLDYLPSYQHLPHPSEMCERLGIGILAADEAHEVFRTNFLIGLLLNPSIIIPITATFVANDVFVRNIFDQFYPKDMQMVGGEYDKFVNVNMVSYSSAGELRPFHYTGAAGYSQVKLETHLLRKGKRILDNLLADCVIPLINEHYISICEKDEKLLLICATQDMCDYLEKYFRMVYKDKKVSVFYSGMPNTILSNYDIIISTPGSAGTGRDIKGLRTCFVFDNTASEIRNLQYLGRLRGPPQQLNTPEYICLSFSTIPKHVQYAQARSMLYGSRAKTIKYRTMR